MERRLATIMAADVVDYSAHMEASETKTLGQLSVLTQLMDRHVRQGGGRVFSRAGDGFLSEFSSPVSAVQAGFQIQRGLRTPDRGGGNDLQLRIGIHLADVVVDGDDLLGDGVNIAARVEGLADPGSVLITQPVFDQVKRTAQLTFEILGERSLKNISEPVRVFRIVGELSNHSFITGDPQDLSGQKQETVNPHSIAVLPFANFSDDPEQEYFSDGFSEDLITELSRFREIFVVSRNASFAFKERNVDLREVGKDLGVAFCLEGSVRKMGSRVRITSQLIDARTGDHVWAEKYDFELNDLFDIQDDLAASIVSVVAGRMERLTQAAAKSKKPADMFAYECLLRGLEQHRLGGVTRDSAEQALKWFDLAIEKDPAHGRAYAWRACALATLTEWTGEDRWDEVVATGRRGLELDDDNAECHRIMGSIGLYARDYERAEYHFERALSLNPNHAYIVGRMGELYTFLGDGKKALEYQRRATKLDPLLPAYCRELEAVAHYVIGEHQETVRVVAQLPRPTRRAVAYCAAALTHLNDQSALDRALEDLRVIDPVFTINGFLASEFYKDRQIRRRLSDDLKKAGLPMT
ncbi:MAG: adenylate/guanylate cyclase domain-containing protein [Thiotrichales bacterium]|nr:adenylate/guanylate cyclase domain-containing protein [Thiotrichales bacterium]